MLSDTSPVAVGFAVFFVFVFVVILITGCCRLLSRSKRAAAALLPRSRYITTLDVQTGLPVVIDISAITAARNQVRIVPPRMRTTSCPINTHTLYGSIIHNQPSPSGYEVLPRTPPPAYSEVFPQPRP